MNTPTFVEGAIVAFVFALCISITSALLGPLFNLDSTGYLVTSLLTIAYIFYLLSRTNEKTGRVVAITLSVLLIISAWMVSLSPSLFVILHLALIWGVRSLYFHETGLTVIADAALHLVAMTTAIWAQAQTGSPFMVVWSFFLVQALFVQIKRTSNIAHDSRDHIDHIQRERRDDIFNNAQKQANAALQKLFTQ